MEAKTADDIFIWEGIKNQKDKLLEDTSIGYPIVVTTLVDGHHGQYVPDILFEIAGACSEGDEFKWEQAEEIMEKLTAEIQEHFDDGRWYLGVNDTDGSIDLFYGEPSSRVEVGFRTYCANGTVENFAFLIADLIHGTSGDDFTDGEIIDIIDEISFNHDDCEKIESILRANYLIGEKNDTNSA